MKTTRLKTLITQYVNAKVRKARHRSGYCSQQDDAINLDVRMTKKRLDALIAELSK